MARASLRSAHGSRSGVHRGRFDGLVTLLPAVVVVVIALAVASGIWLLFNRETMRSPGVAKLEQPTAQEPATPTDGATSVSGSPTGTTSPSATNKSKYPLVVKNATTKSGLGARVKDKLTKEGWTVSVVTNSSRRVTFSAVYYDRDDQEATARQVADDLGISQVEQDSASDQITVVVGPDLHL